ncbi:16S rRNA (uracil(1498)-N(3))-methyltransferase [Candidatus Poribacteria bacterium]|nr:16S rRNA (uracil(1498)-N(3))-methyltransferase [Candidatus Poribacteria bacterium]
MHTFYVPPNDVSEDLSMIDGSEHHHLKNVLRLNIGDSVRIIDGIGNIRIAKIANIRNDSTIISIIDHHFQLRKKPEITLFQAIPKYDKMELIIQKTTELGISKIVPVKTKRSLQEANENRIDRWKKIIVSATKQCKAAWVPKISEVYEFEECLKKVHFYDNKFILWEKEDENKIKTVVQNSKDINSIAVFIGPEGGFEEEEVRFAMNRGCKPVSLGTNILRTETAAIAITAILNYVYQN